MVVRSVFLSNADGDVGNFLSCVKCVKDHCFVPCGVMHVWSPLEPEKQCLGSCRIDRRNWWLSLEVLQGFHTFHRV